MSYCASSSPSVSIDIVKKAIADAIAEEDEKRGDGTSIGPTLVRLAWHASGTYSIHDKTGGSNGSTMRLEPESKWGANAGLANARAFLEPIAKKYSLSQADAWTLAGATAIEAMGGPSIPWKGGRVDSTKPTSVPDGRLPGADKGSNVKTNVHLRDIFHRMGFSDQVFYSILFLISARYSILSFFSKYPLYNRK